MPDLAAATAVDSATVVAEAMVVDSEVDSVAVATEEMGEETAADSAAETALAHSPTRRILFLLLLYWF